MTSIAHDSGKRPERTGPRRSKRARDEHTDKFADRASTAGMAALLAALVEKYNQEGRR